MRAARAVTWAIPALVAVAALARLAAARGDLWLDEVWSLRLAKRAGSLAGIFVDLHHDNNHHLNTAWLLLVGEDASPLVARLFSVVCGAGAVALVARWPRGRAPFERLAGVVLVGFSYALVHYGSEARGYSPAVAFSLAAYVALAAHLAGRTTPSAMLFAASATLAVLSHLSALFVVGACFVWAAVALARERRDRPPRVTHLALLAVPGLAFVGLWWLDVRHLVSGGAPPYELITVLRELLRITFGLPRGPAELLAAVPVALASVAISRMIRERDPRVAFFAALVVLPALLLLTLRPDFLVARYFLVIAPLFLLLVASGAQELAAHGRSLAVAAVLAAFTIANAFPIGHLVSLGRGSYRAAVERIFDTTLGRVTIGSNHDRTWLVLDDQARRIGATKRLAYFRVSHWPRDPEWLVLDTLEEQPLAEATVHVESGRAYTLVETYPYPGLSGLSWMLYRAVEGSGAP
jgi:hypothetical protein